MSDWQKGLLGQHDDDQVYPEWFGDEDEVLESCDGSCVTIAFWCPVCNCLRRHFFVSDVCVECCECGNPSEVSEDFGKR